MFRGDSARGIVGRVLRKGRHGPRVGNSIGTPGRVVGSPLGWGGVGRYLVKSRRDLGRSSVDHTGSPLDRVSIHRCSARTGLRLATTPA